MKPMDALRVGTIFGAEAIGLQKSIGSVEAGKLVRVLSQWRPKKQQLWTYHFVYAGSRYALPKVKCFIQTALDQV